MNSYEEMRAKVIKQARRDLLEALGILYTVGPAKFDTLCGALTHLELPDDTYMKADLTYLIDKGYVEWTNAGPLIAWRHRLYRLTAKGKEIVDRIAKDSMLEP